MSTFHAHCRHRREPRARWVSLCRSPRLFGLRMVTPDVCLSCPFTDHHYPGDGTDPGIDEVHPDMSVERLVALIDGPTRSWPLGWEDWEVTHRAHQLAAARFLGDLPPYPAGRFSGRGIVIAGGGVAYFPSLYVTVRAIRHVGCTLPIQVWYLGRENELPADRQAILAPYGVECVDADRVRRDHPCRILNGWELKVYAVLHSPFEEVLSLDADCYPVRDPSGLFEERRYRETGARFWPDLPQSAPLHWPAFGAAPPERGPIETGQFVMNKRESWRPLQLAWWYCDHSDWSFIHGYGDKGALEAAFVVTGHPYAVDWDFLRWSDQSFLHAGPDGKLLFVHRCQDKFRLASSGYMTQQAYSANRFRRELPLEAECFSWLGEFAKLISTGHSAPGTPPAPRIRAFMTSCPERRETLEGTLARWRATDWGEDPAVMIDQGPGPLSNERYIRACRRMLEAAYATPADYYLFMEDDLLFNLHLRWNVTTWAPVRTGSLWMGSFYNPGIELVPPAREGDLRRTAWMDRVRGAYYGSQAILLSRLGLETTLREWHSEATPFDVRAGAIAGRCFPAIEFHIPSLVQHVPVSSTLANISHRAIDFDPLFRAPEEPAPS